MKSLLPPAASDFELDVESVIISAFDGMPAVPFLDLWRAESCPAAFLAWLAWANSVDTWDNTWPDEIKRRTILAAGEVHKRKGTAAAVRGAVDALGAGINIIEWWQEEPPGTPRHFKVDVTPSPVITNDLNFQRALINAIERTKPLSTRYDLQLRIEVKGEQYQYAELRPVNYARLRAEEEGYVEPEPSVYPYDLSIVNPSGETGDMTGWTITEGEMISGKYSLVPGAEGSERYFYPGNNLVSVMHQDVPIPVQARSDIDAGLVNLEVSFYRSSYVGQDDSRVGIQFFDAAGDLTDIEWTELASGPARGGGVATWSQYTYLFSVPAGSQAVRYTVGAYRDSGSSNDALTDVHRAKLILS